jgi:hypothetical protein
MAAKVSVWLGIAFAVGGAVSRFVFRAELISSSAQIKAGRKLERRAYRLQQEQDVLRSFKSPSWQVRHKNQDERDDESFDS